MRIVGNLGVSSCGVLMSAESNIHDCWPTIYCGLLIIAALTMFWEIIRPLVNKATATPTINIAKKARAKAREKGTPTPDEIHHEDVNSVSIKGIREDITRGFQRDKVYRHAVMVKINDFKYDVSLENILRNPEGCSSQDILELVETFFDDIANICTNLHRIYQFMDDSVDQQDADKALLTRLGELQKVAKENDLILVRGLYDVVMYAVWRDHEEEIFRSDYETDSLCDVIAERISRTAQRLDSIKGLTGHRPATPFDFEQRYNRLMGDDITQFITGPKCFDEIAKCPLLRNFEWLGDQLPE